MTVEGRSRVRDPPWWLRQQKREVRILEWVLEVAETTTPKTFLVQDLLSSCAVVAWGGDWSAWASSGAIASPSQSFLLWNLAVVAPTLSFAES